MKVQLKPPKGIRVRKAKAGRVPLLILEPEETRRDGPGVLWIHGGGYILGMKEMAYMSRAADLCRECGAVVVSPGYRLALFSPYPAALEDCYAALLWLRDHAEELGIRQDQIMVGGESAGGGLAAAVSIRARDSGEVRVAFQMPLYPMLDNRDTDSSRDNHGRIWNTRRNHLGWRFYLRGDAKRNVSPYASPARLTDFRGLPPCYTFVGTGEPFRDETLAWVRSLREAEVPAECDLYDTDIHAFDMLYPELDISREASARFLDRFREACRACSESRTDELHSSDCNDFTTED